MWTSCRPWSAAALLWLAGCGSLPPVPGLADAGPAAPCVDLYRMTDERVAAAGVADREGTRIPGFHYLRINRMLASYRDEVGSPRRFDAWVDHLRVLARSGWDVELANLPAPERAHLAAVMGGHPRDVLAACAERLRTTQLSDPGAREALRERARVPDAYRAWQRVLGLYPITGLAFRAGIARWHRDTRVRYTMPLESLPLAGRLLRYGPDARLPAMEQAADRLRTAARDPLGFPRLEPRDIAMLFNAHAPVFEIDTKSQDDSIGAPVRDAEGRARVDIDRPTVFQRLAWTRRGDTVLAQLVYTAWFPRRTATGPLDLLAEELDGLVWRVTLDARGRPLLYDSIHPCGCYYLVFPAPGTALDLETGGFREPPLSLQAAPPRGPEERTVLRVAAGTHYLLRVTSEAVTDANRRYVLEDASMLRRLPLPGGGTRSLFGPDGLIAGSERGERVLFWPMGIPSAGAMRQWGHHAIAFVGRRHFDDPELLAELLGPP